jgi:hypothetical protein
MPTLQRDYGILRYARFIHTIIKTNKMGRTKQMYEQMYLDYFNNFISTQRFAEYYDLSMDEAKTIIIVGRKINHERK